MIKEDANWPALYPALSEMVYAPRWYYQLKVTKDEYSRVLTTSSKIIDESEYFWTDLKQTLDTLTTQGLLNELGLITIIPSSELDEYSPTLLGLGPRVAEYLGVPFEIILQRLKPGSKRVYCKDFQERYALVENSMKVEVRDLNEKFVLLLDDTKTTGMTILEAKKILLEAGARKVIPVCLGIHSREFKEGESHGV